MARTAVRQADLFEERLDWADIWRDRLLEAFAGTSAGRRVLPLAEEAVAACPEDRILLLLAATAAVLDAQPERALVLLGRLSKVGSAPVAHVLQALALNQLGRRDAARALLEQHGLGNRRAAQSVFPRGFPCIPSLIAPLDSITRGPAPVRLHHSDEAKQGRQDRHGPGTSAGKNAARTATRRRPNRTPPASPHAGR